MRKTLLVTLQGDNIGNRLQNYALQETLKGCGCEVWNPYYGRFGFRWLIDTIKFTIKCFLGMIGVKKYKNEYYKKRRLIRFNRFNKRYIDHMFKIDYCAMSSKDWSSFDCIITGSDQVWHGWSTNNAELQYFYLQFVNKDRRISYAPSFGFDKFPDISKNIHKTGINGIKYLSCREKKGAELIKELTGRDASVVVDPTLLLEKDEWISIEKKSPLYKGKDYLLIYFLGNKIDEYMNSIDSFARENNLEIIDVFDINNLTSFMTTPDEFIWLVHNSKYICTDSFHATVFSIIFNIKFLSFKRKEPGMEKMFDRIETLLDMYGVSDRVFDGDINYIKKEYIPNDICEQKSASRKFLQTALEG